MKNRRASSLVLVTLLLIAIRPANAQQNTAAEAERLYKQVVELSQQGRFAEALPLAQQLVEMVRMLSGEAHPAYATSLNSLADIYIKGQGKYAEGEPLLKKALEIYEKALGPDHPAVGTSLNNLAEVYRHQGRYAEAEPLYRRALAIGEKALGPDHAYIAIYLNNLGLLNVAQGRYAEAEPLYKRALAIVEKALGPDNGYVASTLVNLAELYRAQGRYAEAEPLYKRGLTIHEKTQGLDHPDVANSLNDLGTLYVDQARYAEAEPLFKRALAIVEKTMGPRHPAAAFCLNNLAELYRNQGRYAEAEPFYRRSLAIREAALGQDHPDVAIALNNLAEIFVNQTKYAEAEPLFKRSLAIRKTALGPDHPDVANALNNLASLYVDQARYAEAEPLFRRSLTIFEKANGPDHPAVANSLNNLAALLDRLGKPAEAEPLYKRSLAIFEKAFGPDHPAVATCLSNLAIMNYARGDCEQAEALFERALQNVSRRFEYGFTYMSEKDRLQFLDTVSYDFPVYFSFCLSFRDKLPALAGKMYDVVLWEKGLVAQSLAALRAKIRAGGDPEALRLLDRLTERKSQLAKLAAAESDAQKQADRGAQADQLAKEANDLEKELVTRSGALGEEKRLARGGWQQVRDALKPDEAAVEIVRFRFHDGKKWTGASYYVALVLRRESRDPAFVVLGERKDLEKVPLTDYRRLVAVPETSAKRPVGLGRRFYAAFWQPLEAKLGGANRVYISPDGELNQVSLAVVPGGDARLLMEAYDLRMVNSTRDLLRGDVPPAVGRAVLVGNPKFELSEGEQRAALLSARPAPTEAGLAPAGLNAPATAMAHLRSNDLRGGALTELQGTQQEVEDVSAILRGQGWQVDLHTGNEALEERVKGVGRPRVLHLATHGFFEADQPQRSAGNGDWTGQSHASALEDPMLRSGLYLAGANRALKGIAPAPDMDDGILTAYEASQLNLQGTELVVLSACETGLGKTEAGEGVFGLRRALQVAGAEAVMMSLWSVPDEETRELMALFYTKWLGGKEKHQALREAQLEMRDRVKARYGEDLPLYWGAFVLVGR
jgi:CHAT domain-containing protein/Tfp pilus assembly protein PilF